MGKGPTVQRPAGRRKRRKTLGKEERVSSDKVQCKVCFFAVFSFHDMIMREYGM